MEKPCARSLLAYALFWSILFLAGGQGQSVPPLPDLTISFVTAGFHTEASATVGQAMSKGLKLRISNGGQAAVKAFRVAIALSSGTSISNNPSIQTPVSIGRMIAQQDVSSPVPAGSSVDITLNPVQIPDDISWGDYYLTAFVDPGNTVQESNENNNQAQERIFIMAWLNYIEQGCSPGPMVDAHGKGFGTWKSTLVVRVGPYTIPTQADQWFNDRVHASVTPGQIPLSPQQYDFGVYNGAKPITRIRKNVWAVWIMDMIPPSGAPGTTIKLVCCTCGQTQGAKKVYLYTYGGGQSVAEMPVVSWSDKEIMVTIPQVAPGTYCVQITEGGQSITLNKPVFKID